MRVMKNKATLLSLAVAGLFAANAAQAVVNLNTNTGQPTYASEISATGGVTLTVAAANAAQVTLGFGFSGNQQKYVRFDLPSTATWGTAITAAMLTDFTTAANFANVTISQGGAATDNYVVFQVTAAAGGVPQADVVQFAPTTIKTTAASTVTLKYGLHDTAISAAQPPSNATLLVATTGNFIVFAPAIAFTFSAPQVETAAATTTFQKFCSGATVGAPGTAGCASGVTDTTVILGGVASFALSATPTLTAAGATITDMNTVLSAGTVTITSAGGDFSTAAAAAPLFVGATNAPVLCNPAAPLAPLAGDAYAVAAGNASASFKFAVPAATATRLTNNGLCLTVNGTSAVPAQTFNASFGTTAQAGYTADSVATTQIGSVVRDGVELQSPWFTLGGSGSAYISRFFLTNTGTTASLCTVAFLSETGNTVTANTTANAQGNSAAGVTVPANGQVSVLATDLVTSLSGLARAAVRFSCPSPSANIQGTYVVTHSSGAVATADMIRPGTN